MKDHSAAERYLPHFEEGCTGITATCDTGNKDSTIAFRFDMYALDIHKDENHFPAETNISIHTPEQNALIEAGKMYAGMTHTKHPKASPLYGD